MDVLPLIFRTCRFCGIWQEDYEKTTWWKIIYKILVVSLFLYVMVTLLIEFVITRGSVDDMTDRLFLTMTSVALFFKLINFVFRHKDLRVVLNKLRSKICQPRTKEEAKVIEPYLRIATKLHRFFLTMGLSAGIALPFAPLLQLGKAEIELPFKSYHPYDISVTRTFIIAYAFQVIYELYGVVINTTLDASAYGLILLTTGQFELCCHRLRESTTDLQSSMSIKDCITHHVYVQDLVMKIESFFMCTVAPLFFCNLFTLCAVVFQMSENKGLTVEFFSMMLYLASLLYESFLYCWSGNELRLKSQSIVDAAYESDWTRLNPHDRKRLLLIMVIGKKGATLSYKGQCVLSFDTFVWIIKTSYGAFSLLQTVST